MPQILARINMTKALELLRESYELNKEIKGTISLSDLVTEFSLRVQKARYSDLILRIAESYRDYLFYYPTFLDSGGSMMITGAFNLHNGDLARGLILFDNK